MSVITGSINVMKIDKARLIEGKKGKYLNIVIFLNDETDQYGNNGMIVQSVSKEEREAGERGEILGNVKAFKQARAEQSGGTSEDFDDGYDGPADDEEIPF